MAANDDGPISGCDHDIKWLKAAKPSRIPLTMSRSLNDPLRHHVTAKEWSS
jgi:hypothetical protein